MDYSLQRLLRPYSVKKIADEAQVSTSTITRIIKDHDGLLKELKQTDDKGFPSRRRFKGFIQSVVKLCMFLDIDPYDVIDEYNDLPFDSEFKQKIIEEVCEYVGYKHKENLDRIRVGVCKWEPFLERCSSAGETWGGRLCKRLVHSVNPNALIEFSFVTDLGAAVKRATLSTEKTDKLDLIFGLYETPSRVFNGLDFIPLPGIEAKLAAFFPSKRQLDWDEILSKLSKDVCPIVIEQDIGFSFVIGAMGINIRNCIVIKDFDVSEIYEKFLDALHEFLINEKANNDIGWPIIVAEKNTILDIKRMLEIDFDKENSRLNNILGRFNEPKSGSDFFDFFQSSDDSDSIIGPSYNVGIAVSDNSELFNFSDIEFAFKKEIFNNAAYLTAKEYRKLQKNDFVAKSLRILQDKNIGSDYDKFCSYFNDKS